MIDSLFQKIGHVVVSAVMVVGSLLGIHHAAPVTLSNNHIENVGSAIPVVVASFQSSLQTGILPTDTAMTLVKGTDAAGHALSGYTCFNIDEGTTNEEFVCGTATGTAITGMLRGIDPVNGTVSVPALEMRHGRGAVVKITDYPSLGIVSRILGGSDTLPNTISYAAGVNPVNSQDLTTKAYVLSVVNGGPITFNQVIVAGKAGETLSAGNLVYHSTADGEWHKTTASTNTTLENVQLGIAQGSGTTGNLIANGILIKGVDLNNTGTAGALAYASNTAGTIASSTGTTERVVGQYIISSGGLYFDPSFYYTLTASQKAALAGNGGTPSGANPYVTSTGLTTSLQSVSTLPVVHTFGPGSIMGDSTTTFNITNPSGTTFRYTYNTGTNPSISSGSVPIGSVINISNTAFATGNNGLFVTTGVGTNFFDVTNASGVVESNKAISVGSINFGAIYTKPAGVKYITIQLVGGGLGSLAVGSGSGATSGGSSGGYAYKVIPTASLGTTEVYAVGVNGTSVTTTSGNTQFSITSPIIGGGALTTAGGVATGGTINIPGVLGGGSQTGSSGGDGGDTPLGNGGKAQFSGTGAQNGTGFGSGAGGASFASGTGGASGRPGVLILTEFFQ